MNDSPLLELLADLRRRLLLIAGVSASVWGLLAGLGLLVFAACGDLLLDFPAGLRLTFLTASIGSAAGLLTWGIHRARRNGQVAALARRLDQTGGSQGEIQTGVDLLASPVGSLALTNSVTRGLAGIAIERATILAENVPEHLTVPSKPLRQAGAILAAAVAGCGVVWLLAPRMAATEWQRFRDPFGDHPPYTSIELQVLPGDLQVVYGRGADIEVKVSGNEVKRVDLVLQSPIDKSPETVPMFPDPSGKWKASVANVTQPMKYHVRAGHARSPQYQLQVLTVPKLESVRVEITPPSYTQRPVYRGPVPSQGIAGLPGTTVRFQATSNRPLAGGEMTFAANGASPIPIVTTVEAADPLAVSGSFTISDAGMLQGAVIDRDGQRSTDSFSSPVVVLQDEAPVIRLMQPRAVSFATPSASLPVILSAEDDYGISRIEMYRSLNDSAYTSADAGVALPPPTRWQSQVVLPLSAYGLVPGDVLKVYARVEDNRPEGAQGDESEVATIRIIAEEELDRLTSRQEGTDRLQAKYREARRRLESVAEELDQLRQDLQEKAAKGDDIEADDREKLEQLSKRLDEEAEALEYLLKEKELPYDLDRELAQELEPMANTLREMAQELRQRKDNEEETAEKLAQELAAMEEQLQQERREFDQNVTEPLELLSEVLELMKDEARFSELYERQESLAERLSSLKHREGSGSPPMQRRMRDLEAEQEQLRREFDELLDDIETHAAQLPEREELNELREQAQEFVQAAKKSGAAESMSEAEQGLAEFSGAKGHAGAKQARDRLQDLAEQGDEMSGAGSGGLERSLSFKPSLGKAASQTLKQLLAESGQSPGSASQGQGSGGGRSSRRNSLNNVGLYGGRPDQESTRSSQLPGDRDPRQQGRFSRRLAGSEQGPQEGRGADATATEARGRTEVQAPAAYRRRVAAYFERVVEDLNE